MASKKKSKGKGKKGAKGPPKMSKKEKKLRAKYRSLMVEDKLGKEVFAVDLRRDELEWAAEKMKEQVTLCREERIRFQLERDFLYDVKETYWKKYRCLMVSGVFRLKICKVSSLRAEFFACFYLD
ncbi:hypothetical protein Fcan01_22317 [Folsomia candida]|uniref:Uncharacterized protein n=1 Tax=Folsomia candida TaxID=158441 RepID=A0A226DF77_FOLCA|nr:hypothetical protein Fcan01_22317 [Folsomia candida]